MRMRRLATSEHLTLWLAHDVLALASSSLDIRKAMFDFVAEMKRHEANDFRRIRPVHSPGKPARQPACVCRRAGRQARHDRTRPSIPEHVVRAAAQAEHIALVLARLHSAARQDGRSIPSRPRRRGTAHDADTTLERYWHEEDEAHRAETLAVVTIALGGILSIARIIARFVAPSVGKPMPSRSLCRRCSNVCSLCCRLSSACRCFL